MKLSTVACLSILASIAIFPAPIQAQSTANSTPAPEPVETNPYWPMCNASVDFALSCSPQQMSKELAGNIFFLAWGYTSPQSKHHGDPAVLEKCVTLWDGLAAFSGTPDPKTNLWNQLSLLDSLRFLRDAKAVDPAKLDGWAAALRPGIETEYNEYGQATAKDWATSAAGHYPNADAQHLAVMYDAYLVYHDDKFKDNATKFVQSMTKLLRPPGAWLYYKESTPIPLYHGFEITFLSRYYQLSHDPLALDMIKRTVDYYPYTYVPENTVEYSSAPWWKQGWNPVGGPYHAVEMVASLTGDARNRWLADLRAKRYFRFYFTVYSAEAWDAAPLPHPKPEPFPDNFIIADASIDGLRGRSGSFSFDGCRGKNAMSFGGCMVADESLPNGYDGYLQCARLGIAVPGAEDKPYYESIRAVAEPKDEPVQGGVVVQPDFGALAALYEPRLQVQPEVAAGDWQVLERWLFTSKGVVAVFEATAMKDNPGTWPEGLIRLGPIERPHALDGDTFNIGSLQGRLLQHDGFAVTMGDGMPDQLQKDNRVEMRLKLTSPPAQVQKGQKYRYAVVFSPVKDDATTVQFQPDGSVSIKLNGATYELNYDPAKGLFAAKNG